MSGDLKEQLDNISGDEPSLHKLDKKLDILIYAYSSTEKRIEKIADDVECNKKKIDKAYNYAAAVGGSASVVVGFLAWIINFFNGK